MTTFPLARRQPSPRITVVLCSCFRLPGPLQQLSSFADSRLLLGLRLFETLLCSLPPALCSPLEALLPVTFCFPSSERGSGIGQRVSSSWRERATP